MKRVSLLLCAATAIISLNTQAGTTQSGWKSIKLQSTEGIQVLVDYQVRDDRQPEEESSVANSIWLNVSSLGNSLSASDQVSAVLNSYLSFNTFSTDVAFISGHTVTLNYAGNGRFTAQAPDMTVFSMSDDGAGGPYISTLSLVINGQWQTNPWPLESGHFTGAKQFNDHDFSIGFDRQ
jgi:hypothetical protein